MTSCTAVKHQPVRDYLINYELRSEDVFYKNKVRDSAIWIGKEKLSQKRVIEIVKYDQKNSESKKTLHFTPLELQKLNIKYGKDTLTGNWKQSDFNFKNIIFSHKENFKAGNVINYAHKEKVYYLSEVLYYNNKQYAVFEIIIADNYIFGTDTVKDVVIFMKKEGDEWVLVYTIYDDPFTEP